MSGQALPPGGGDPRRVAAAVNALLQGRSNNTGTVTLTPAATSTALSDPRIGGGSTILFMPRTANAAAALSGLHVATLGKGTATLAHASNAQTDRVFGYAVIG